MSDHTRSMDLQDFEESDKMMSRVPCLVVLKGAQIGHTFVLETDVAVLGRGQHCTFLLMDDTVSREHAKIERRENKFIIHDLGSTNGIYVNGNRTQRAPLHDGDKVRLGNHMLRFAYHDSMDVGFQENLRKMAMHDSLTNLYNRRYFFHMLEREHRFAVRAKTPLSMVIFDIDDFKKVNDQFGHEAGDHVLWSVASEVSLEVRGYDTFARYGGEEFALLLRESPIESAIVLAERIRSLIEGIPFRFDNGEVRVTVSLGVSSLDFENPGDPVQLVRDADMHLYRCKKSGKNRVCSIQNEPAK